MKLEEAFVDSEGWEILPTDTPCRRCGQCCIDFPCPLAGRHDPCLALEQQSDGRYACKLVDQGIPGVAECLLIGQGCGATLVPKREQ